MSDISARVKAIIVDKLGVDENEVTPEGSTLEDLIPILKKAHEEIVAIRASVERERFSEKKLEMAKGILNKNDLYYIKQEDLTEDWFDPSDGPKYAQNKVFGKAALKAISMS